VARRVDTLAGMRTIGVVVIALVVACAEQAPPDAALPTCAELGCRWAASGTPGDGDRDWTPCSGEQCWCRGLRAESLACSRVPCGEDDACPASTYPVYGYYYIAYPNLEHTCFCDPDPTLVNH
jgi:hypothetical protein